MYGPAIRSNTGLSSKKATMVFLYQSGAWPRKFWVKELRDRPCIYTPWLIIVDGRFG
jgi:hypothetical protein